MPYENDLIANRKRTVGSPLKEFVVPEGDFLESEDEEKSRMLREQHQLQMRAKKEKQPISESGKKRVEMLCGMLSLTKEVKFNDTIFVVRLLRAKEAAQIASDILKLNLTYNVENSYAFKHLTLAKALVSINNIDIDTFLDSANNDDKAKQAFVEELQEFVVDYLFKKYTELNEEVKVKYGIKTEEQAKELAEDIKK
jgi:hypothetical protein